MSQKKKRGGRMKIGSRCHSPLASNATPIDTSQRKGCSESKLREFQLLGQTAAGSFEPLDVPQQLLLGVFCVFPRHLSSTIHTPNLLTHTLGHLLWDMPKRLAKQKTKQPIRAHGHLGYLAEERSPDSRASLY